MMNKLIENINIMNIFGEIWNIIRCFVGSASEYSQDQEFAPGSKKKIYLKEQMHVIQFSLWGLFENRDLISR